MNADCLFSMHHRLVGQVIFAGCPIQAIRWLEWELKNSSSPTPPIAPSAARSLIDPTMPHPPKADTGDWRTENETECQPKADHVRDEPEQYRKSQLVHAR